MPTYKLNVILDPNLNESQLQIEKDAVTAQVERAEGEITEVGPWWPPSWRWSCRA